jgi:hypothetical protein
MRVLAGAIGGAVLGAAAGWFLPAAFLTDPDPDAGLALLAFQGLGLSLGAMAGLILGGGLAMKYFGEPFRGERRAASAREGRQPPEE